MSSRLYSIDPQEGEPITIIPRRSPGMSYDTEPGLQPWEAEFAGSCSNGRTLIWETSTKRGRHLRIMSADSKLTRRGDGHLQLGDYT